MTSDEASQYAAEHNPDALVMHEYAEAFIGMSERWGQPSVAVYSWSGIRNVLMRDGLSYEEADEYISFNVAGAWMGDGTPILVQEVADER